MSIGLLFWILMILWFFSWAGATWGGDAYRWTLHVSSVLLFVLLFLVGWKIFGFVIHE